MGLSNDAHFGSRRPVRRAQINLHHHSPGETVRGERAKSAAKCCLSVKIARSCRDIGEMQWNRCHPCHHDTELVIVESFTAFTCCFLDTMVPSLCLCTFAFFSVSIATMFAHLCLQLRSSTASWYRAYFVSQRADALHWIVHFCDFLAFPLQLCLCT